MTPGGRSMSPAPVLTYTFEGEIWSYKNPNEVFFVTLPQEMSGAILDLVGIRLNPWGTVPVSATIDAFSWKSSMFPRPERGVYDLPLNARVRKRLKLECGQAISVSIEIAVPF
jgi:hypothetical protein